MSEDVIIGVTVTVGFLILWMICWAVESISERIDDAKDEILAELRKKKE